MGLAPDYWSWESQTRRGHQLEEHFEWDYKRTWVFERDHPDGWAGRSTPPEGDGWELNTEVGDDGTPGYRVKDGASGRMILAYWRRKKTSGLWITPPARRRKPAD